MKTSWSEVLGGLAVFLGAMALLAAFALTGYTNGQKVQDMTRFCVEQGYEGWSDASWSEDSGSGCVK